MNANRPAAAAVFANRPLVILALTQAFSLMGDKVNYMALLALFAWFAARDGTDPSRAIATISVAAALPAVIFAPVAGVVVDRADRRNLMLICDIGRAVLIALLPLVAVATGMLPVVFGIAFLVFLGGLLFNSARLAIIPQLLGPDRADPGRANGAGLVAANSFMSLTGRIATLGGMVIGGLMVDWTGWQRLGVRPAWSSGFYFDALTYLVSVVGIILIYRQLGPHLLRPAGHRPGPGADGPEPVGFLTTLAARVRRSRSDIAEAWRLAGRTPPVLFVYGSALALITINTAFLVLYIPVIQGSAMNAGLGRGTSGVGFTAAIGAAGLLLSSIGYGLIGHRFRRESAILAGLLILGGIGVALPFIREFALIIPLAFIGGLALTPVAIAMDTILHETVPAHARGRIFSNREWVVHIAFAASALGIGQLTRYFTGRSLLFGIGLFVLVLTLLGFIAAIAVRRWHSAQEAIA